MNLIERAKTILNLEQYNYENAPEFVGGVGIFPTPEEEQYILRMPIKNRLYDFFIPKEFHWVNRIIEKAIKYQEDVIGIIHPFIYLTIRHGVVKSVDDDIWHVDGFSLKYNHIPEQNYVWSSGYYNTEYVKKAIKIDNKFDPFKHNIHQYFQDSITSLDRVYSMGPQSVYCLDPYIIHRRPQVPVGTWRTFVRVSFCPIEIIDVNNTVNPEIPVYNPYNLDGVKSFRDNLERFKL